MKHPLTSLRHAVLPLLPLLFPILISAQELSLKSMVETAEIMSVRDQELDGNQKICALIKVFLPKQGAVFSGSIVKQEYRVNEYWVYVPPGRKVIRLQCPGFHTVDLAFGDLFPNGLQSKRIYRMDITGYESAVSQSVNSTREGNYVVFALSPPESTVEIDGQAQPLPKDGRLSVYLRKGTHAYKVSAYGYASESSTITMGEERQNLSVQLTSLMAGLSISCADAEAEIYINDERKGKGRWTGPLAAGVYHVEARRSGYSPAIHDIVLAEKDNQTINLDALTPLLGSIDVNYEPLDAEVWLDGKKVATSPDIINALVGKHTVEIRASGYDSKKLNVTIAEGETASLTGSLTKTVVASPSSSSGSGGKYNGHAYVDLDYNGRAYVDLGLSVKWATCNVGARSPEEYGEYYAWGETSTAPGNNYSAGYCLLYGMSMGDIGGNSTYDAARANWGGSWRLPTYKEMRELIDNCDWEWTTQGGKSGYKVTSKENGASIFLPAAGYRYGTSPYYDGQHGNYWTSTPYESNTNSAYRLFFGSSSHYSHYYYRSYGFTVRPVAE